MMNQRKPQVFIGSSAESLAVAYALQENIEYDADVEVWPQGTFELSGNALDSLIAKLEACDFGIFVFASDDVVVRPQRQEEHKATRDNVILELGLCIGIMGRQRAFIVKPVSLTHVPSDLQGLTTADYREREGGNLKATLGPACNRIRTAMQGLRLRKTSLDLGEDPIIFTGITAEAPNLPELDAEDAVNLLEDWLQTFADGRRELTVRFAQADEEAKLPPGTTAQHIQNAAHNRNFRVTAQGTATARLVYRDDVFQIARLRSDESF